MIPNQYFILIFLIFDNINVTNCVLTYQNFSSFAVNCPNFWVVLAHVLIRGVAFGLIRDHGKTQKY